MTVLTVPGAGQFSLIKPLVGFKDEIETQLTRFPYEKNVFLMLKYRTGNESLSRFMEEVLEQHGLRGVRADRPEWDITRNVFNPLAVLYCCRFGIALFDEPEPNQAYSPNVAYELGIMHYQGKDCLILRHASLPTPPFDLIKDLYKSYSRDLEVRQAIRDWVEKIALAPYTLSVPAVLEPSGPTAGLGFVTEVFVSTPENTSAWGSNLSVLQRRAPYWRLTWKVMIQNRSRGPAKYRLKVVYKDNEGHSLDDQNLITPPIWEPQQQREFSEHFLLHHELGELLGGATIYVAREE